MTSDSSAVRRFFRSPAALRSALTRLALLPSDGGKLCSEKRASLAYTSDRNMRRPCDTTLNTSSTRRWRSSTNSFHVASGLPTLSQPISRATLAPSASGARGQSAGYGMRDSAGSGG
jgi:hypothetical protein